MLGKVGHSNVQRSGSRGIRANARPALSNHANKHLLVRSKQLFECSWPVVLLDLLSHVAEHLADPIHMDIKGNEIGLIIGKRPSCECLL